MWHNVGPAVSALQRAIAEVKLRWSVIWWVTRNLLSRAPPCFGRHVKPLVPAAFTVIVPTNPHWARVVGYGMFSLYVIHKEGLCPSSGDINRLMMMIEWLDDFCMKKFNGHRISSYKCKFFFGYWIYDLYTYIPYIYIPLTLYPRRGSRGISDIPPRHPRFTKIS
jgi:hypothetical protein